jgi:GH24 family phage-related lysozyme (muramidase)
MDIFEQLRRHEGDRATPYQDSRGNWTVGVGHNMAVPLSWAARDQILRDDVAAAHTACLQLPFWSRLSDARQGALLNLTFNEGIGWVGKNPKMYGALEAGDYATAAKELLDGPYKDQVGRRAHELANQLERDVWI